MMTKTRSRRGWTSLKKSGCTTWSCFPPDFLFLSSFFLSSFFLSLSLPMLSLIQTTQKKILGGDFGVFWNPSRLILAVDFKRLKHHTHTTPPNNGKYKVFKAFYKYPTLKNEVISLHWTTNVYLRLSNESVNFEGTIICY